MATLQYPNPIVSLSLVYRYSCKEHKCADESGLRHGDVIGCRYFCKMDANGDGKISKDEMVAPFLACTGGDRG